MMYRSDWQGSHEPHRRFEFGTESMQAYAFSKSKEARRKKVTSTMAHGNEPPPLRRRLCKRCPQQLFRLVASHLNIRAGSSAVGCLRVVLGGKDHAGIVQFVLDVAEDANQPALGTAEHEHKPG